MMQSSLLGFCLLLCAAGQADVHKLNLQQLVTKDGGMPDATSLLDTVKAWALEDVQGKFHADPTFLNILQSIVTMMNDVINVTLVNHGEDQAEIDRSIDTISACQAAMLNSFTEPGGVNYLDAAQQAANTTHVTCREEQVGVAAANATDCSDFYSYAALLDGSKPACVCPSLPPGPSAAMLQCIQDTAVWANQNIPMYEGKRDSCSTSESALINKVSTCHTNQATFESTFCSYAQSLITTCETHTQCRSVAVANHASTESDVKVSEAARKAQYQAARKINCYVGVLNATEASKPSAFANCTAETYDTTLLDIVYPGVPAAAVCDTSPVDEQPCSTAFLSKYYIGNTWSSQAPTTTCSPCALATTPAP